MNPTTPAESRASAADMLKAAQELVERGYQLTLLYGTDPEGICECSRGPRCKSAGKHPRERHWVKRPIRTPEELQARWAQSSGTPNLGVMPDDALLVIDVDRKNGKRGAETLAALQEQHGSLGEPTQTTPSGGWHFVFRLPPDADPASLPNRAGVLEGIDILRTGRQFVAAPSQVGARRYEGSLPHRDALPVLPLTWLAFLQSLGGSTQVNSPPTDPGALEAMLALLLAPSVQKAREVVTCIPNNQDTDRGQYVWMAHAIRGACGHEGIGEGLQIFLEWAARWDGPVDPAEDERVFTTITWQNVRSGWPDLWKLAERHGYDASAEREAEAQADFATAGSPEGDTEAGAPAASTPSQTLYDRLAALHGQLAGISEPLRRETERDAKLAHLSQSVRVPFAVLRERLAAFDAPHRHVRAHIVRPGPGLRDALSETPQLALVAGYVFADMQHVLYGTPQSLKTFTALDLGLHIASGRPWLGRIPVQQRGVVFFAGEAASGLRVRIAAWCAARGISVEQAETLPFALIDALPTLGKGEDGLQNAINRIREATSPFSVPAGLLVLDNMTRLAAVAGLSTTDVGEFGRILAGIDALGRTTQTATLTIYHSPISDPKRPAGTYQSMANPDVVIKAEREGSNLSTLLRIAPPLGKSRGAAPPPDIQLKFKVQDVSGWLAASYNHAGLPLPSALADATAGDFECVNSANGEESDAAHRPALAEAAQEASRQQFTSLVVADGSGTQAATSDSNPAKDHKAARDAELEREIIEELRSQPGASQTALRAALHGRDIDVDHAVCLLIRKQLVEDRRAKPTARHTYHLTDAGQAGLQAIRARDEAAISELQHAAVREPQAGD